MGITIHYNGTLDDPRSLPTLLAQVEIFCHKHDWEFERVDDRILGMVERFTDIGEEEVKSKFTPIDETQRGIIIQPHSNSESLWLTFNSRGELCFYCPEPEPGHYSEQKYFFTKTQFAPIEIHIAICDLLHMLKDQYITNLEVSDEGEYFEIGDAELLARHIGKLDALMDMLEGNLKNFFGGAESGEKSGEKEIKVERGKPIPLKDPLWSRVDKRRTSKN